MRRRAWTVKRILSQSIPQPLHVFPDGPFQPGRLGEPFYKLDSQAAHLVREEFAAVFGGFRTVLSRTVLFRTALPPSPRLFKLPAREGKYQLPENSGFLVSDDFLNVGVAPLVFYEIVSIPWAKP